MSLIYFRILGYSATIAMHGINSLVMLSALQDESLMKDPELKTLADMQHNFLTIWNVLFQIVYAGLGLSCEVLTLMNKDYLLSKSMRSFRQTFFSGAVFPITLLVFTIFWPLYIFDRSIVFPEFIDKVFSQTSNYIMHFGIIPVILWEVAFNPRTVPESHKLNLQVVISYYVIYNSVIFCTYAQKGLWPYPFFYSLYGTIYFPLFFAFILFLMLSNYYLQWPLVNYIWGYEKKVK